MAGIVHFVRKVQQLSQVQEVACQSLGAKASSLTILTDEEINSSDCIKRVSCVDFVNLVRHRERRIFPHSASPATSLIGIQPN